MKVHLPERKLYAAFKNEILVGLFSSHEKAMGTEPDSTMEVRPFLLEGTPVSDRYVCLAKGSSALMQDQTGEDAGAGRHKLGWVCGWNPQAAAAALLILGRDMKDVKLDELLIVEIDGLCADGCMGNVTRIQPFRRLVQKINRPKDITEELLTFDYIGRYCEILREEAERWAKGSSMELTAVADRLTQFTDRRRIQCGQPPFSLTQYRRNQTITRIRLMDEFSLAELKKLFVLLELPMNEKHPALSCISLEEAVPLVRRALDVCQSVP